MSADSRCEGVSTARWTGRLGSPDRTDDPAERDPATASAEGVTAEAITTDAIGGEPDTSGASSLGSPSTWTRRCTVDGSAPVEAAVAAVAGNGIAAVTSAEGDSTGPGPGGRGVSTARWTARSGPVDRVDDPADGLGPAERDPAAVSADGVTAEAITTDAIGGEPDTSGATSIGATSIGCDSGSWGVSTARWTARPSRVDRDGDPASGLGATQLASATDAVEAAGAVEAVTAAGVTTDAIGGVADTSGATSSGSTPPST
ncbi:MAG: hypothetical protein ACRDSN_02420 [Pseudonocardiaceae bacterium]